jgi:hypothetical protein
MEMGLNWEYETLRGVYIHEREVKAYNEKRDKVFMSKCRSKHDKVAVAKWL